MENKMIQMPSSVWYNSVQFEGKPNLYEMSEVKIRTETESSDDSHVKQTSDGSCDIASTAIDQSVQICVFQIKDEPNMDGTSGTSSCHETGFFGQLSDASDNTEKRDVYIDSGFVFRDGMDFAVCIKYEPNSCEAVNSVVSVNDVSTGEPDNYDKQDKTSNILSYHGNSENGHTYYAYPDTSQCYVDDRYASNVIQSQYTQVKCEISEHPTQKDMVPYNNSNSIVNNYHAHNHIFSKSNEKINSSANNDSSQERKRITEKMYKCDISRDSITMSCHAETNYQKDTERKQYKCDGCTYSTVKPYNLVRHKRKHTGEKPYKCDVCSYSATRSDHLVQHQAMHTGEKPYMCDVCSYSSIRSCDVVRHKKQHTGETPYKCNVCSYRPFSGT